MARVPSFDLAIKGDLPSPTPLFVRRNGRIVGANVLPGARVVRVWCAFGQHGWFVMKQEDWPDNLGHFGDWREEVKGFRDPLKYPRQGIF
jgi:hypothetical protein